MNPSNGPHARANLAQSGFTLLEALITLGLSTVAIAAFGTVVMALTRSYQDVQVKYKAQESLMGATLALSQVIGLAVNVSNDNSNSSIDGIAIGAGQGRIRAYTGTSIGGSPSAIDTIGVFLREAGGRDSATNGMLRATGIFYQRPAANKSGVIFVDPGNSGGSLRPDFDYPFFDRIVGLSVGGFEYVTSGGALSSLEISITARYFYGQTDPSKWNWCPQADITANVAGCAITPTQARFSDITQKFRVSLRNQIIGTDPRNTSIRERTFGNIHFFPFQVP